MEVDVEIEALRDLEDFGDVGVRMPYRCKDSRR